jgi:hypothetical protein
MIEAAVILSGWSGTGRTSSSSCAALANAVVGFWEEHQAGNAIAALKAKLAIKARVKRDGKWITRRRASWCRATSSACAWATSCRRMRAAGRRPGRGGSVRADRRVAARHAQIRRGGVLRLDHSSGRDRRAGLCHGREHLLRQDRGAGAGRRTPSATSSGRAEDRQLPDHPRGGPGGGDHRRRDLSAATRSSPRCSSPWC